MRGLLGVFLMSVALGSPAPPPSAACTRVAREGIELRKFVNSLRPGDVGCLRSGNYGGRGVYTPWEVSGTNPAPISLRGYPGDLAPRIRGFTSLDGDHLRLSGLVFDGPNGDADGKPAIPVYITGDDVELSSSEVTGSESQGIYLQDAARARVIGNHIVGNGKFSDPAKANLDHGIYFSSGSGLIAGNVIEGNYAYGIQLYPSPSGVVVQGNTIVGQGKGGVIVGGASGRPPPRDNLVASNVIAYNDFAPVSSFGRLGPGNEVRGNLLWANGQGGSTASLSMLGNVPGDPKFVGPHDLRLGPGSAAVGAADLGPILGRPGVDLRARRSDLGALGRLPGPPR